VPILIFIGLSVLDLGPMNATDVRQTDVRQKYRLMPPPITGGGIKYDYKSSVCCLNYISTAQFYQSDSLIRIPDVDHHNTSYYYTPPLIGGGIKRCFCLTSVCLSVAYIGPNSRTERPRKTERVYA